MSIPWSSSGDPLAGIVGDNGVSFNHMAMVIQGPAIPPVSTGVCTVGSWWRGCPDPSRPDVGLILDRTVREA